MSGLGLWTLRPLPCPHEAQGRPHATHVGLVECVLKNGAPGFDVRPADRALTATERQRRWRRRARARLLDAYGGFCGGGAPVGVGCGANGATPLQFAHVLPTGLSGRSRGFDRILADVRRFPSRYCVLCEPCHRRFDEERGPL